MTQTLCEWGLSGIYALQRHAGVFVIVDVLSFSTAVDVAVSRRGLVYPFAFDDMRGAQAAALQHGARLARPRGEADGGISLSPVSLLGIPAGTRVLLPSPNGSRLSLIASRTLGQVPVLSGCLRNAGAVARAAQALAGDRAVAVIPAGERWADGSLRPAIEDWLGAGAVLDHLGGTFSPEAEAARDGYRAVGGSVERLVRLSVSGRELVDAGFSGDVDLAIEQDSSATVPMLRDGAYRAMTAV